MHPVGVIEAFRQANLEIVDEGRGHFRVVNNTDLVDTDLILEKEPRLTLVCSESHKIAKGKVLSRVFYGILN